MPGLIIQKSDLTHPFKQLHNVSEQLVLLQMMPVLLFLILLIMNILEQLLLCKGRPPSQITWEDPQQQLTLLNFFAFNLFIVLTTQSKTDFLLFAFSFVFLAFYSVHLQNARDFVPLAMSPTFTAVSKFLLFPLLKMLSPGKLYLIFKTQFHFLLIHEASLYRLAVRGHVLLHSCLCCALCYSTLHVPSSGFCLQDIISCPPSCLPSGLQTP